jgi:threonine dehydrogenase-like Zn-dependent dehydrogenase
MVARGVQRPASSDSEQEELMTTMRAAVFENKSIKLREVPRPKPGPTDALLRITLTTICGTDVHILKGEYPVRPGLVVGHEPVGVIEELGSAVTGYSRGDRVIVGAITPCGQCRACLSGSGAQCSHGSDSYEAIGGWRFGNTLDGCQAEYVLVPNAQANLAKIPDGLRDEEVILCPDIMSTGFSASERGNVRLGDVVVVFALGPIGLCAVAGAKMSGAALVIGVDSVPARLDVGRQMGADIVLNYKEQDVIAEIRRISGGGADVAIEALGTQDTFEKALRAVRPGGDAVEPGGLFRSSLLAPRCHGRRPRRSPHRDHPLPRRKGAHAPPHEPRRRPPRALREARHPLLLARPDRGGL